MLSTTGIPFLASSPCCMGIDSKCSSEAITQSERSRGPRHPPSASLDTPKSEVW